MLEEQERPKMTNIESLFHLSKISYEPLPVFQPAFPVINDYDKHVKISLPVVHDIQLQCSAKPGFIQSCIRFSVIMML